MACSGIPKCESRISSQLLMVEKTRRCLSLGIEMINYIKKQTYGSGQSIKLKIGIHTGKVIAGVIGHHKPQFSLIGDTVNTTSRICSNSNEQSILLSEEAYNKIKTNQIQISFFKRVIKNVKGKGDLTTYQIDLGYVRKNTEYNSLFKERISKLLPEIRAQRLSNKPKDSLPIFRIKDEIKQTTFNLFQWIKQKLMKSIEKYPKIKNSRRAGFHYSFNNSMLYSLSENVIHSKKDVTSKTEINEVVDFTMKQKECVLRFRNKYLLIFEKKQISLEKDFLNYLSNSYGNDKQFLLMLLFFSYFIHTCGLVLVDETLLNGFMFLIIIFRGSYCLNTLFFIFFLNKLSNKSYFQILIFFFAYYGIIASLFQLYAGTNVSEIEDIQILELLLIYMIVSNCNFMGFVGVLFLGISTFGCIFVVLIFKESNIIENIFFILGIILLNTVKVNLQIRYHVQIFNTLQYIEIKKNEQNDLVSQLLPYHVI